MVYTSFIWCLESLLHSSTDIVVGSFFLATRDTPQRPRPNSVMERQKVLKTYLSNRESTLSLVTFPKYCLKTEELKIEGNGSRCRSIIISLYCSLFSVCTSSCKCVLIETKTNRFAFYLKSKQKISMQMFFYGSIVNIQR